MRIDDVHRYLRTIEARDRRRARRAQASHARSRHDEGIDYTGVWVAERKIASIGVHVSRGVTTHGFAVNVENDLEPFSWVVACGLPDVAMTSLARELARGGSADAVQRAAVARRAARCSPARAGASPTRFCQAHGRRQRLVSPARLGIDTANASRRAPARPHQNDRTPTRRAGARVSATRSRSNPGGMDVLERARPRRAAAARAQAAVVQGAAARRRSATAS